MELALYIIIAIVVIVIFWKPFSAFRKEVPEGMTLALKHGTRVLKVNILEDENEMQNRLRKIKESRDNNTWIDVDNMWDEMHSQN